MNAPEKTIKCFTFPENSLAKISYLDAIDAFFNEPFVLDTPSTHKFFREKLREIATKITERSAANLLVRRVKPLVNEMALEEFCFLTKPRSDERFCSAYYAATAKLRELSLI